MGHFIFDSKTKFSLKILCVLQHRERSGCYFTNGVGIFKTSNEPLFMQGCLIREVIVTFGLINGYYTHKHYRENIIVSFVNNRLDARRHKTQHNG
jgi:hypothetical protein